MKAAPMHSLNEVEPRLTSRVRTGSSVERTR